MNSSCNDIRSHWTGPMVWRGGELQEKDDWIVQLDESDIGELRSAVAASRHSGQPLERLTETDFQFGQLGERLLALRDELLAGRGFALIRGVPAAHWNHEDLVRAYWGMGCWLGDAVSQNAKGHLLGHVIDQRLDAAGGTRIYQTNRAQPFHSDSCDIVGLLCLRVAKTGGASSIASSAAIHNALLDNDPEALDTLYNAFQCDRYNEIPAGKLPSYAAHVFNQVEGKLVCCGMDPDIRSAQRLAGVTDLTQQQLHALDAFQSTAKALALNMILEPGDIQFVHNHTVVHARSSFEDYQELDRRRYLVRLWMSSKLARTLPEFMAERWGNIEPGTVRGGISIAGVQPAVYLDPAH